MSAEKDYISSPLKELLEDVAAKSPTPGGGSVAATVGALAASLGHMVLAYTEGKAGSPKNETQVKALLKELTEIRDNLGQLIREDMLAYERFVAARKSGDEGQQKRAVSRVVAVPMEIIVLAGALAARLDEVKGIVNANLLSDLQTAAVLVSAAGRAACTTVRANLRQLPTAKEADRLENRLDLLMGRLTRHRNAVVHYQRG